jgi:hypothetical protein
MSRLIKVGTCLLTLVGVAACGPIEVRISKAQGVRPISRSFTANINSSNFTCGDSIVGDDGVTEYVVTSARVEGGCQFAFDQEVEVLNEADYEKIKEFKGAFKYANRVEIEMQKLDFYDETGDRFAIETRVRDIEFWLNGKQVLNREQIGNLPQTITVEGEALRTIKQAVKNRQRCTARIQAKVTVLDENKPTSIRCEIEGQPSIILSSSEI